MEQRRLLAAHIVGGGTFATIQAAVDAAAGGQTILVDAGTYSESVVIHKQLTLKGAKAGIDARSNTRSGGADESIVNGVLLADGKRVYGFRIIASNVTLDGFVVQGQSNATTTTGAGIVMGPSISGTKILNNIVQNNVAGLYLSNNSSTNPAVIQNNLFRGNNNPGFHEGRGIYSDGGISGGLLTNVTIDNNFFYDNMGPPGAQIQAAIGIEAQAAPQNNIRITNNAFDTNGKAVLAYTVDQLTITGNIINNHWDVESAALRFEGGCTNVTVQNNNLYASGGRAIRIDNKANPSPNSNFTITGNNIYHNGREPGGDFIGLRVDSGQYSGTLNATNNWWGDASGPSGDGPGAGDAIYIFNNSVNYSPWATAPVVERQAPWTMLPWSTDARIQAEDFDHGMNGVAYNDLTAQNSGGEYRPEQGVDIDDSTDTDAGYMVMSTRAGEWIEYALNVPASGTYRFDARVQSSASGGTFHLEIDGVNVSGPITLPNTAGAWQTISKPDINLTLGTRLLRLVFDTNNSGGNVGNWNHFAFFATSVTPPPAAPSALAASAVSSSQINLSWTDNSSNETGFLIERNTGSGATWETLTTTAANVVSFADTAVAPATTYFYRVRATSTVGDSPSSNQASATTPAANIVYLSDLQWVGTPTNGWGPVEKDMSNGGNAAGDGNIITLNGVTYAKGLGTHADSEIIYNLSGAYAAFLSDVGVDDSTGAGTVVFHVYGDNVLLYQSPLMTQAGATQSIDVSVAGVQQLRLVVTNGGDNYSFDHADWAGARLMLAITMPPSNLTAAASGANINLAWTDTNNNETATIIEKKVGSGDFLPLATVGPDITTYSDTSGFAPGTTQTYRVRVTTPAGESANSSEAALNIPATQPVVYLSDREWTSMTNGWGPVEKDRNVGTEAAGDGGAITLNGVVYAKGLGTHAVSDISYDLAGAYWIFTSDVGIDDATGGGTAGQVEFFVYLDASPTPAWSSGVMTGVTATRTVTLNVTGVNTLRLVVGDGGNGNLTSDWGDWASARLIAGDSPVPTLYNGSASADTYTLRLGTSNQSLIEVLQGATPLWMAPIAAVPTLRFNTAAGDDTLTVEYANPAPLPAAGVFFDGGAGSADTLIINGSAAADTVTIANAAAGPTAGNININDPATGAQTVEGITFNGGAGNDTLTIASAPAAALAFNGGLTPSDHDTLNLSAGSYTFNSNANLSTANLTLNVNNPATSVTFVATQHLAALAINDAQVTLAADGTRMINTGSLAITGNGKLDLKDNDMIVRNGALGAWDSSAGAYTGITGLIQKGFNTGTWTGAGGILTSMPAATATSSRTHLAVAQASSIMTFGAASTATWQGQTVTPGSVLIKYTYIGDTKLSGALTGDDYFRIDTGYSAALKGYANGDFDFSGRIDADDYFWLDLTYASQAAPL